MNLIIVGLAFIFLVVIIVVGLYLGGVIGKTEQSEQQPTQQQSVAPPAQQQTTSPPVQELLPLVQQLLPPVQQLLPPPPPKVWKQSGQSQAMGGGGGAPQSMVCRENTFVTEFTGGSGELLDRIGVKCSDGTSLGPFGGGGGAPFTVQNPDGFDKLVTRTDSFVNSIRFFGSGREILKVGGDGGGAPTDLACNGGQIIGLNVRTGSLVDNIQVVCGTQQ